ncbi:MAG: elongation factor G [Myxococcales bacterium]|nr:elongation factor G [Myxococcales bacterium]
MTEASSPRCVALVGPYQTGKTTLLEALLSAAGALKRKGTIKAGTTVGDASPEARARQMGVEMNAATCTYLGDTWTVLDCPGSIEFGQDAVHALQVVDAAVVVVDPLAEKAPLVGPLLRLLDELKVPHYIFVNRMDVASQSIKDVLHALQSVSQRPLLLREIPIREGDKISGYVDLVSERAWKVRPGQPSEMTRLPEGVLPEEQTERNDFLEHLADFDDTLLEALLEGNVPPPADVYKTLTKDVHQDLVVPVFFGSAEVEWGVRRLWKALRHEAPEVAETAQRLGIADGSGPLATVVKTWNQQHIGRLSLVRLWTGTLAEGGALGGQRLPGIVRVLGAQTTRVPNVSPGEVVGLQRLEGIATGQLLAGGGPLTGIGRPWPQPPRPVYALTLAAEKRTDDVKLAPAIARLCEEDHSLRSHVDHESHELLLEGQGEIHLKVALDRLRNRYGLQIVSHVPPVPYRETLKGSIRQRYRHKKQTGGAGQFGEIEIDVKPLPRGGGVHFVEKVFGGSVPRNYIPSVGEGVMESFGKGPLGFPVVDVEVTLLDGQYHAVDSSDMAFKIAGRGAMAEAMPKCQPILLEPVGKLMVQTPSEALSGIQRLVSGRRGQIVGMEPRDAWPGWDTVTAWLPQSELHDFIVELRSITAGIGTFTWDFDHLQELTGRLADKVVEAAHAAHGHGHGPGQGSGAR